LENYAINLFELKKYTASAYVSKWVLTVDPGSPRTSNRQALLTKCREELSNAQIAKIAHKTDGFSLEDMQRFARGPGSVTATVAASPAPAGSLWARRLNFPVGTRVVIEDGPKGATYDAAADLLSWQIPQDQKPGTVQILLSVTPPGKQESHHRVDVSVQMGQRVSGPSAS
jgi:hypothetical protein